MVRPKPDQPDRLRRPCNIISTHAHGVHTYTLQHLIKQWRRQPVNIGVAIVFQIGVKLKCWLMVVQSCSYGQNSAIFSLA